MYWGCFDEGPTIEWTKTLAGSFRLLPFDQRAQRQTPEIMQKTISSLTRGASHVQR